MVSTNLLSDIKYIQKGVIYNPCEATWTKLHKSVNSVTRS